MPDVLGQLRQANLDRQWEWFGEENTSVLFRAIELAGEVGEACNIVKKLERARMGKAGSRATIAQLADELADVIICVDLLAQEFGIDMRVAVPQKFNATSERYGLKTRMVE